MQALDSLVKSGKVRALGASAMYGYQFYNMQMCAKDNGFTPFVSMQNHYSLLYREDERELISICDQMNVARTPYSPLAAGKYDSTESADYKIVLRVNELAEKYGKYSERCRQGMVYVFCNHFKSYVLGTRRSFRLAYHNKTRGTWLCHYNMITA